MFRTRYHQWVNHSHLVALGRGKTSTRRKFHRHLQLEALELRLAPATHVWGGALGQSWSTAANWSSGGAPKAGEADVIIQFPLIALNCSNTNDIANLVVQEIDFVGSGYTIGGNEITLLGNTKVNDGGIFFITNTINLGLDLAASVSGLLFHFDHVFNVTAGSTLNLNGPLASPAINLLDFRGQGTLTLADSANSYEGTTLINQGTLSLGANNAVPASSAVEVGLDATFNLAGFNDTIGSLANAPLGAGDVNLGKGTLTAGSNNASTLFSGTLAGSGGLTKAGTRTLTLTGPNTYPGATILAGGILKVGANNAIPSQSSVAVNSGTLDCRNFSPTIGSLEGTATGLVEIGPGNLTTGGNDRSTDYGGNISGTGQLVKAGKGTMTLSGTMPFAVSTFVGGGTLLVNGLQQFNDITVGGGFGIGTLSGVGSVGAVTINDGTLSPGTSSTGILNSTDNVTFNSATSTFHVRLNGTTAGSGFDQFDTAGAVDLIGNLANLDVTLGFAVKPNDTFTILSAAGGITGHFNLLPDNTQFTVGGATFVITYPVSAFTSSVVLTCLAAQLPPRAQTGSAPDTVGGITGSAVITLTEDLSAPPGHEPGGLAVRPALLFPVHSGPIPTNLTPSSVPDQTIVAPLVARTVDGFFASTQHDAHRFPGLRTRPSVNSSSKAMPAFLP